MACNGNHPLFQCKVVLGLGRTDKAKVDLADGLKNRSHLSCEKAITSHVYQGYVKPLVFQNMPRADTRPPSSRQPSAPPTASR